MKVVLLIWGDICIKVCVNVIDCGVCFCKVIGKWFYIDIVGVDLYWYFKFDSCILNLEGVGEIWWKIKNGIDCEVLKVCIIVCSFSRCRFILIF